MNTLDTLHELEDEDFELSDNSIVISDQISNSNCFNHQVKGSNGLQYNRENDYDSINNAQIETLYNQIKIAIKSSDDLDEAGCQASLQIFRKVLQERVEQPKPTSKIAQINGEITCNWHCSSSFVPKDIKDFWRISSLSTLVAYEDENGRHYQPFSRGTLESVEDVDAPDCIVRDYASNDDVCFEDIVAAHPTVFVSYEFTANISGIAHLESEARNSWGATISTTVTNNRRYSEFHDLYYQLSKLLVYRTDPFASTVTLVAVPPLPGKHSFRIIEHATNNSFVNKRRRGLQVWLTYVSLHGIMNVSLPFRRFILDSDKNAQEDDTLDSYSVVSNPLTATTNMAEFSLTSYSKSKRALYLFDDPLINRRVKLLVEKVRRRYGSGSFAVHVNHSICSSLLIAMKSCMMATRRIINMGQASYAENRHLGATLLHLSKEEQHSKICSIRSDRMLCHPITGLGIMLFHESAEEHTARLEEEESHYILHKTLKLWATSILPRLKTNLARLNNTIFRQRELEDESCYDATPCERLAAEWLENSQVRCCMLASTLENIVKSRIKLAISRRRKWEKLREHLVSFEADGFLETLSPLARLPEYLERKKFKEQHGNVTEICKAETTLDHGSVSCDENIDYVRLCLLPERHKNTLQWKHNRFHGR